MTSCVCWKPKTRCDCIGPWDFDCEACCLAPKGENNARRFIWLLSLWETKDMMAHQINNSKTLKIVGVLLAGFIFCSTATARQSRLAPAAGTNSKVPAVKASVPKVAAVTTRKATVIVKAPVATKIVRPTTSRVTVKSTAVASNTALGQAVANFASGKITGEEFTRQLAGFSPRTIDATLTVQPTAGTSASTLAPSPVADFALVPQDLPAVTETARFKSWTWSPIDSTKTDYMVSGAWFAQNASWLEKDPVKLAATMKSRPAGERILFLFWDLTSDIAHNPADKIQTVASTPSGTSSEVSSPWMDNGIGIVRQRMEQFLAAFTNAGGVLDAVIIDNETNLSWHHGFGNAAQNAAIESDPRFPALAAELGFDDLDSIGNLTPKWIRWNAVLGGRFDAAMQTAVYEPIRARFPNAVVSNYESFSMNSNNQSPWCTGTPDLRTTQGFGTHDTHSYYGIVTPSLGAFKFDSVNPVGIDQFSGFRLQVNRWRACDLASNRPMQAWISLAHNACDEYGPSTVLTLQDSTYYGEMIFHLGIQGCETFLCWNSAAWKSTHNPANFNRLSDQMLLDSCLRELNVTLGQQPGAVVAARGPGFGDNAVASGRQVGERMVWRFTFAPGINSVVVKFMDGTTQAVTAENNRPGAWFSYPASKQIRMNAQGTAPEMVTATAGPAES